MAETSTPAPAPRLMYLTASALNPGSPAYTHATGIVEGLRRRGWVVVVLAPSQRPLVRVDQQMRRLFQVIAMQCRAVLQMGSHDAIYCRWHFALWPAARWARFRRVPIVQEINGPYEDFFTVHPNMAWAKRAATRLLRAQMAWADTCVAVTGPMKSWIQSEVGPRHVVIVPNGADTVRFSPDAVSRFAIPEPYAVFVGSLAPWQGVETLLSAVEDVAWPPDLTLAIAGDGPLQAQTKAAARKNSSIVYLGSVPHDQVPGLIARSLAGLAPKVPIGNLSRTGFSALKLYETLACGVPIVATDTPGHRETIAEHDCGILVPVNGSHELALALKHLLEHPAEARRMGECGRNFIESEASWDRRSSEVDQLLRNLGARGGTL